jgi:hypothetical protein
MEFQKESTWEMEFYNKIPEDRLIKCRYFYYIRRLVDSLNLFSKTRLMKKFFLLLVLLPALLSAQNDYRQIITTGRTYYTDSITYPGYLAGIRIDSVYPQGNGDTVFLANNTIRPYPPNSNSFDTAGGILGRKVWKLHDGWFRFVNVDQDTLYLKTKAVQNDSWKFCNLPGKGYLEATCLSVQPATTLGVPDTIKVISFQSKDSTGSSVPCFFNGKTITLSRSYGLVALYDLHHMPDTAAQLYKLVGRNSPVIGFQGLTWHDVYDFGVGDVFQFEGVDYSLLVANHLQTHTYEIVWKVLAKDTSQAGLVSYTMETCRHDEIVALSIQNTYSHDTIHVTYSYTYSPADPVEPFMPEQNLHDHIRYYSTLYHQFPGRPTNGYDGSFWGHSMPSPQKEYTSGLGLTWTQNMVMLVSTFYFNHSGLVYFQKGNDSWGTPLYPNCNAMFYFGFNPDTLILASGSNECDTLYISTNASWHFTDAAPESWYQYYPVHGNSSGIVKFCSVYPNSGTDPRYHDLILWANGKPYPIVLKQTGNPNSISGPPGCKVSVSPNPAADYVEISISGLPSAAQLLLTIKDLSGREVARTTFYAPGYRFNRGLIPAGMYILTISDTGGTPLIRTKLILE